MPTAILILIGCQLLGELLRAAFSLPIPGPVVGMFLLAAILVLRGQNAGDASVPSSLDKTAGTLISHMGLLFVPAGVGIIAEAHLLRQEWLPILAAVVGSTVLGVAVTGFVMHRVSGPARRESMSNAPLLGHPEGRP
jgi:holin-like protein